MKKRKRSWLENWRIHRRRSFLLSAIFDYPFTSLDATKTLSKSGLEIHQARIVVVATWILSLVGLLAAFLALHHFLGPTVKIEPGVVLIPAVALMLALRYLAARLLLWLYSFFA